MKLIGNGILFILTLHWSFKSGDCYCESNHTYLDSNYCTIQSICYTSEQYDMLGLPDCDTYDCSVTFINICQQDPRHTTIDEGRDFYGRQRILRRIDIFDSNCEVIPAIQNLENLEVLNIHGNKLVDIFTYQNFPSLSDLDVSKNAITQIVIASFDSFPNLVKLNASFNNINTVYDLGNVVKLKILDLSSNKLEILNVRSFSGLTNLEELRLSNNRLTQSYCAFSSLTQLQKLKLDFNQITDIKEECFVNLEYLKVLILNSNNITNVEWIFLKNKPSLAKFDISYNRIKTIDKTSFTDNTILEYVDISHNRLAKLYPDTFLNKNLSFFSIEDNLLGGQLEIGMFEGMKAIAKLDISYQEIDMVKDHAFYGLTNLVTLLLNNNKINALQKKAFRTLINLEELDLSNNLLLNIDYEKDDLIKLKNLNLQNNLIDHLEAGCFLETESLIFLDISHNNITRLEKGTFQFLREVVNFDLSNNAFVGALEEGAFEGLGSLPSLDLSYTSLYILMNKSFVGLLQLNKLNISHSDVHEVQFNAVCGLNELESMDLSFNKLTALNLNFSCIEKIKFLLLNENLLTTLGPIVVNNLIELDLSFNKITNLNDNAFEKLKDLGILNLSYNNNLTFSFNLVRHMKTISSLLLAGLSLEVTNSKYENQETIKKLDLSDCNIVDNITTLWLDLFINCDELNLSGNKISYFKYGMISKNTKIRIINLSFNEISYIHPGSFIYNKEIEVLNVAHNKLIELEYGIFKGMDRLNYLDISYNNIRTLHRGVFDETLSLRTLIADNNDIKTIDYNEFSEARSLQMLSIGGNPISCSILVHFNKFNKSLFLTALVLENYKSNYHGISCHSTSNNFVPNSNDPNIAYTNNTFGRQEELLEDIKGLLKAVAIKDKNNNKNLNASMMWSTLAQDIHSYFNKTDDMNSNLLAKMKNDTKLFTDSLYKIVRNFNLTLARLELSRDGLPNKNQSSDSMISYLLQDLDKRMSEIEKLHSTENRTHKLATNLSDVFENSPLVNEKAVKLDVKTSVLQDICLSFIAIVILCSVLYKLYKSDLFVPVRRSISTRRINESIETATL